MDPTRCRRTLAALLGLAACAAAWAAPQDRASSDDGVDTLRRNGAVSRHLWTPEAATVRVGGMQLAAGVALGLRPALRDRLGQRAAPALTLQLDARKSVSLLAGSDGGAMLVLQVQP